jgi:hypothetical protein
MPPHERNRLVKALRNATDKELADFMAGFHSGASEWVICQQELARRQGAPGGRGAWIAIGTALAAALVLALLIWYLM